jgi:hypothetical protein
MLSVRNITKVKSLILRYIEHSSPIAASAIVECVTKQRQAFSGALANERLSISYEC